MNHGCSVLAKFKVETLREVNKKNLLIEFLARKRMLLQNNYPLKIFTL